MTYIAKMMSRYIDALTMQRNEVNKIPTKITSLDQLKQESLTPTDFIIVIWGPLRGTKNIYYDDDIGLFHIISMIDGSHRTLTEPEIAGDEFSLISKAIREGRFYKDD